MIILTSIIIIITIIIYKARACTCGSRVNNYSFYGIFNYVQKTSTLSFSSFSQRTGLIRGDSIGLVFL